MSPPMSQAALQPKPLRGETGHTDMMQIADFVAKRRITLHSEPIATNPNLRDQTWKARHFACTLSNGAESMLVNYSHLTDCPTVERVLDSLAVIAMHIDRAAIAGELRLLAQPHIYVDPYREWVSAFSEAERIAYKLDRRVFDQCVHEAMKLQGFLGTHVYLELLNRVERLP